MMDKKQMQSKLEGALKKKRFKHSLGVCAEAVRMAELFGADPKKAYIAGLLHDCAKCLDRDEEKEVCRKYSFEPDEMTKICHPVLHAPLGAVVARYEYDVKDEEILDAIRYHTTARANMTLMDKILYVADMTEPNREYDGVDDLRKLSKKDIDAAYKEAVYQTLMFNLKKGSIIHPDTLNAWNEICKNKNIK